jgi:hypothetical protein
MEFDPRRCIPTRTLNWVDPRALDDDGVPLVLADGTPRDGAADHALERREGTLMWLERFDRDSVDDLKSGLGPYLASGRLQQSPSPKHGSIFARDWF